MSQTAKAGLYPEFWAAFPDFGDEAVALAKTRLVMWAKKRATQEEERVVRDASVEFTRLFIGPPAPIAPPWETMNGAAESAVGFGEPTFQMRRLLREAGFRLAHDNHQYEDHVGVELLYASELARRAVDAEGDELRLLDLRVRDFLAEHPLSWIDRLRCKVEAAAPDGYYLRVLDLAKTVMAVV